MNTKLIIVESPTKAKTIQKFLEKEYKVKSSFGHVRDLPLRDFGVDIENNFQPKYIILPKAKKIVNELKKEAAQREVILATDEDREGESIAWHLKECLNLKNPDRIVFHEITPTAIKESLKSPRKIDMRLVNAQQARRILDRIVGYKLSPFLWEKVAKGLSAGRVQSVAVRLIVEREEEIKNFVPQEYWIIEAIFEKEKQKFIAILFKKNGKIIDKLEIKSKEEAQKILKELEGADYQINKIEKKEVIKKPFPPFTTSTLQQTAWQKYRFTAKTTMSLAQKLYETGLITYHRTDSLNLSDFSLFAAKKFITENFGNNYWAGKLVKYKTKSTSAQEAHEAIRPTYPERTPQSLQKLSRQELKLYSLIWQRFIACQMAPAIFDSLSVEIQANNYTFKTTGQTLKFEGFLKVWPQKFEEKNLPPLKEEEKLKLIELKPSQHFTQPPPRYNEASLIKTLEKFGIGRPSTYAPILTTIQLRNYVKKDQQKRFFPTETGILVNEILVKNFPEIVDVEFTARMEKELDLIAENKIDWQQVCNEFWISFKKNLEEKYREVQKSQILQTQKTNKICPRCGGEIVEKFSKFGKFYACSNFPLCNYTQSIEKENQSLGIKCPKCQKGEIVGKTTKKGKIFYGCNHFPECDFALWDKPLNEFCPKCNSILIEKNKKIICSNQNCDYRK